MGLWVPRWLGLGGWVELLVYLPAGPYWGAFPDGTKCVRRGDGLGPWRLGQDDRECVSQLGQLGQRDPGAAGLQCVDRAGPAAPSSGATRTIP